VPVVLVLVGLVAYVVLGGADFGAGFWDLTARGEAPRLREHTHRALAPVWEANHVWLVYVLTVTWTAYPTAFGSIASTLAAPLLLAAIGIILRGASYAARSAGESPTATTVFSLSSVLTPFALGAAIGGIASGRVPTGNAAGDLVTSWLNPTSIAIGALAVATSAYLAAVYLAGDAERIGSPDLLRSFRARALGAGLVAGGLALGGIAVVAADAEPLFEGLTSGAGLAAVIVSALAGLVMLALVAADRYRPARFVAAAAVAAIVAGWGLAQEPYLLPPELTIEEAAAGDATLIALLVALAIGAAILVPSLALLFGLVLRGRFDAGAALAPAPAPVRVEPATGRERRRAIVVLAMIVAGVPLTLLAEGVLFALGVVLMLAFVAAAFALLVTPARLNGREASPPR
jgi:cytochrome d ubiquinol oxidase subunit II